MRAILCVILALFTVIGALYAEDEPKTMKKLIKLVYEEGYLKNIGEEDLLKVEIISPMYRYIGDIPKDKKINVSDIKTQFTVRFTIKQWIGEYETMKETFIPTHDQRGPDVGLDVRCFLEKGILTVQVTSIERISDVFIEILSDVPIRISNDRVRYVLSTVGTRGQSLKRGPEAKFELELLIPSDYYKVPIEITYVYKGCAYDKVFFYSFRKEDFNAK
jgi:hypothetical protein